MSRRLSLVIADEIASSVVKIAQKHKFKPVSVVVMDSDGNTIVTKRMDGCPPIAIPQFAHAKAYTCIGMKMSSREFRDRYTSTSEASKYCQMLSMVCDWRLILALQCMLQAWCYRRYIHIFTGKYYARANGTVSWWYSVTLQGWQLCYWVDWSIWSNWRSGWILCYKCSTGFHCLWTYPHSSSKSFTCFVNQI